MNRIIISGVFAVVGSLSIAPIAFAQLAATRLSEKITQSTSIDPTTKVEITKFIEQSIKNLKSTDSLTVRRGREMIVSAMTKQKVSPAFRPLFAAMILPDLKKIISDSSSFQATNALEIVKALQCPDSIALLAEQTATKNQPSASLRLVAAGGLANLRTPIELTSGQADGVLNIIASSAVKETDWMIAAYDLQALSTFSTSPQVPKTSQTLARTALVRTLGAMVGQIRKGTTEPEMIRAVNRTLAIYLRDQVPLATQADVAALMKALEPTLKEIKTLTVPNESQSLADAYTQTNKTVDTIFKTFLGGKDSASGGGARSNSASANPPAQK